MSYLSRPMMPLLGAVMAAMPHLDTPALRLGAVRPPTAFSNPNVFNPRGSPRQRDLSSKRGGKKGGRKRRR